MIWFGLATTRGESAATTYPFEELSVVFAGTGVKTRVPSDVVSGLALEPKTAGVAGLVQLESPFAGFATDQMCAVRNEFP
jgi:hypothetical protein